ncbi:putative 26S proteasome non-ATPase regulatory subunit 14 [Monocercomonoides exilis]|uniref:putative 26S proteasome non-ATPase regulatory subunit 14 n=1 Tax=Monocercomonoides exilis TaxID=2049356 RepID=UPI00355A85DD|nr:putative 26S proteasome non-ATPase regulatory subunit 14 [Monocercomonoides exilis]|eukprot:MONOS_6948.1-p1 / transcript=MONOS_6948.1 / gene=MONOS_6948 / organism=Monocercomonoides_exilis_PA203 / gene_product=26S proteasome non-ATPase regulatory subunit 14 / transcript_product=26S proteasome non-ATPase regulatory subunit 14 / location=Mono_scaffold00228:59041-60442(-) / protein_length=312 / sequence_SO=supercontig / SO=protein_coding / is_pseudo=false
MDLSKLISQMQPQAQQGMDEPVPDVGETITISSLALLKMLKHGRAGVPLEVMGLMLGSFVDDYTIRVDDVFAMPQSGTGVSVEAVDEVFQQKMIDLLKLTGRTEVVVGWYHSHPGFGPWLSGVDMNTQQSFEKLHPRAVAVVVDPVQSVKGKVVIDAFRLIPQMTMMTGAEPRQTTSNIGHLARPSLVALVHGCGRQYYSMPIEFRKNTLEEQMLLNLKKKEWMEGMKIASFTSIEDDNEKRMKEMVSLADSFNRRIIEETSAIIEKRQEKQELAMVGKVDPKKQLDTAVSQTIETNLSQTLGVMLSTVAF